MTHDPHRFTAADLDPTIGEAYPGAAADARYAQALGLYEDGELTVSEALAAGVTPGEVARIDAERGQAWGLA